ncbi:hypothetical protein ID866_6002 [Astraeus odoratus]|nr:hypothetical protein ID866_6002 [Astraeus odoratus]
MMPLDDTELELWMLQRHHAIVAVCGLATLAVSLYTSHLLQTELEDYEDSEEEYTEGTVVEEIIEEGEEMEVEWPQEPQSALLLPQQSLPLQTHSPEPGESREGTPALELSVPASGSQGQRAWWNKNEQDALVQFLYDSRGQMLAGSKIPKHLYSQAALHIVPYLTDGPAKTSEMCSAKWSTIKRVYRDINAWRHQPGAHWDNEYGADIQEQMEDVWNEHVKDVPGLRRFKNRGWPYYTYLEAMFPPNL